MNMNDNIKRILISEEEIQEKIIEMGHDLGEEYKDKNPFIQS